VRTRRALALGAARESVTPLEHMLDDDSPTHPRSRIDALLVVAANCHATGNRDMARAAPAAGHRNKRAPQPVGAPTQARARAAQRVASVRDGFGRERKPSASHLRDILRDLDGAQSAVVEPLTEREQTVLAFLPTLMTNAEIADELLVSVNTVKSHLKSIYRKLGVESRRAAVLRARQLQFI
jgi:LuxR family maltose regulon positive regulatory protein